MTKRTFNEAVDYTLDKIRSMPIMMPEKQQIVGMIIALQVLHEEELKK